MRPRLFPRRLLPILLLLCLAPAAHARADDGYRDEESAGERETAMLTLSVDEPGTTNVSMWTPVRPTDPDALVRALTESVGFPLTVDRTYDASVESAEGEDEEYGSMAWFVGAHNEHAFARDGWLTRGRLDPRPLLRELRALGVRELRLQVTFEGEVRNLRLTGAEKFAIPAALEGIRDKDGRRLGYDFYHTSFATEAWEAAAPVEFSWGYGASDVLRQSAPLFAYLLLPPLFTIWMCRRIARSESEGSEAVWGRYFRYLSRIISLSWLVWLPVHSLAEPNDLLALFAGGSGGLALHAAEALLFFAPPLAVVWLCHLLSSGVYRRVRGAEWDARAVVRRAVAVNALMIAPFLLGVLALEIFAARSGYAGPVMLGALVVGMALMQLAGRAFNPAAYALTHGPLRDRVNALAAAADVAVKELLVLPDHPAQLTNAFARSDNAVLVTGSLLRHLSRREVDAILAHEIGHLKARHPQSMGRVWLVSICVANFLAFALATSFGGGPWTSTFLPLSFLAASLVTFFLSRGNERHADSVAVNLTNDPEAFITGMARVSRLNLMPLDGSTWGDVLNTHPATMQRLRDVAGYGRIAPERFEQLLASARQHEADAERYEAAAPAEKVFSAAFRSRRAMRVVWAVFGAVVVPPTLLALLLLKLDPSWATYWMAVPAGAVLAFIFYQLVLNFTALRGLAGANARLRARVGRGYDDAVCVGLAPASEPRYYEMLPFWDAGLLRLEGDVLRYDGEETSVRLRRDQVREVYAAGANASWLRQRYVYLNWRDPESGRAGTFYLVPLEARTLLEGRRQSALLHERLTRWLAAAPTAAPASFIDAPDTPAAAPAAAAAAPDASTHALPPACDAVTGVPMSAFVSGRAVARSLVLCLVFSVVLSAGIRLPFWGVVYAFLLVLSMNLLDLLPRLRGRLTRRAAPHAPHADDPAPAYSRGSWAESET